jgi:phosphoglycerol transferase MdoB-like AlkP superfamily enzyme
MIQWFSSTTSRLALVAFALFLAFSALARLALLGLAAGDVSWTSALAGAFACGLGFDVASALVATLPWLLLGLLMPQRVWRTRAGHWLYGLLIGSQVLVLTWIGVAEFVFWKEFGVRFNFIAVDYLVFTQEVLGNIFESYPMGLILTGMVMLGAGVGWLSYRSGLIRWTLAGGTHPRHTAFVALTHCGLVALALQFLSQSALPAFDNQYNGELAKNGCWSFMAAFRGMELDYDKFYAILPATDAHQRVKNRLVTTTETAASPDANDLARMIQGAPVEKRWNVITICMESMSASYTRHLGNPQKLTPSLDQAADDGVCFENLYATGTRTVRGMEALTLSLPPTPGQSILYRPDGSNLRTSFSEFLERGYDCAFIYGGHGQFDYMNRYFSTAGCRLVDLGTWQKAEVTCATAWGACDGDLFRKTLAEADADHAAGKPFHFFCMTTSNHRPYVFPAGCIDLPSGSGRDAAVKYSDWAVGQLLAVARTKPWFANTLFVLVADHCASSAGKAELDVTKYHIPAILYNPGLVSAKHVATQCSQIDLMPTVFGLLARLPLLDHEND